MECSAILDPSWPFQNMVASSFDQSDLSAFLSMDEGSSNLVNSPFDQSDLSAFLSMDEGSSNLVNSPFDQSDLSDFLNMNDSSSDYPYLFSSEISGSQEYSSYPSAELFVADNLIQVTSQVEQLPMNLEGFESDFMIETLYSEFLEGSEGSFPPQQVSSSNSQHAQFPIEDNDVLSPISIVTSEGSLMDSTPVQSPLALPGEEEGAHTEVILRHLLQSCAEAMEDGQKDLKEVILRCISEKVSPIGQPLERVAFNLCQEVVDEHQQGNDYLKQESLKNVEAALKLVIQNLPYTMFAHNTANSAILEAIPLDAETVHIVDFDMGEGLQLAQLIEALAHRFKTLKVTAIKAEEEESECAHPHRRFQETKKQLQNHARSFDLNLKVEEVAIDDLVSEIKRTKKRGGGKEFYAFNCMSSLPHMRRRRSRRHVMEFLRLAKDLLANSGSSRTSEKGIITFVDGDACEKLGNDSSFSSFFNENLVHYQALLESIESSFPSHLGEARMVIECIFLAPHISSQAWFQKWSEMKEDCNVEAWFGLQGKQLSNENFIEAQEIVGDERSYGIKIEGQNSNEIVLDWRGTPLVRVSTWENQC